MKVLLTGAHLTPAQAVIEELKKLGLQELVYIGRSSTQGGDNTPSVESQILPTMGVKFIPIRAGRIKKYLSFGTVISLLDIPIGFIQAFKILLQEKPDVIVSFGGYVAVPVVLCGWLLSIPVIIHEQTLVSGLANTVSGIFASKICVTFASDYVFSKDKMVITGNPLRESFLNPKGELSSELEYFFKNCQKKPVLLITGGNQGSHTINQVIEKALGNLTERFVVIHQTGDSKYHDFERLSERSEKMKTKENYYLFKFINEDWGKLLRKVDLVISRGGVNTLLELSFLGIPTVIIPLPFLYKNEQVVNAKFFTKHGLGEMLEQDKLTEKSLMNLIDKIFKNYDDYKQLAKNTRSVVITGASKNIVQEILSFKNDF